MYLNQHGILDTDLLERLTVTLDVFKLQEIYYLLIKQLGLTVTLDVFKYSF